MFILTNVSHDVDGRVYAGSPALFDFESDAIRNAKDNLADDYSMNVDDVEREAQENWHPYVLSLSKNGRIETYIVSKIPDTLSGTTKEAQ